MGVKMGARILLILAFALIAACGGGGGSSSGPPPVPTGFLYVNALGGPNAVLTDIYGFTVYSNGTLSLAPGSPAQAEDGGGGPLAITRDSKLLYTPNIYELTAFQVNADGSLTPAPSPSFPTHDDSGVGLVTHPTADFLYASSSSGVVSVLAIDSATGALNLTSSVSLPTQSARAVANSAVITPNGRYLYQNFGQYPALVQIAGFSIDSATGALSPMPGSPISPSTPSTASASQMVIDPAGKYLYASYQSFIPNVAPDGGVDAFSIDSATGELTAVPGSPFSVGGAPGSVAIDVSGRFLIVGLTPRPEMGPGGCLAVLSIDPGTGALKAVSGSPFGSVELCGGGAGAYPSCGGVAADPSGPFVYTGTQFVTPTSVFALSIDQTTGALAIIGQTAIPDSTKIAVGQMAPTR